MLLALFLVPNPNPKQQRQVDANCFSPIGRLFKDQTVSNLPQLIRGLHKESVRVLWMNQVYDWKSFLQPTMQELHGHTSPHSFRIARYSSGNWVGVQTKEYDTIPCAWWNHGRNGSGVRAACHPRRAFVSSAAAANAQCHSSIGGRGSEGLL